VYLFEVTKLDVFRKYTSLIIYILVHASNTSFFFININTS